MNLISILFTHNTINRYLFFIVSQSINVLYLKVDTYFAQAQN